ncbi:hypothetical protein WOLCODRAFT_166235 [Wolfiporia cocos MD-104 SS10]|uniref:F-box domain-containing protein n=1 Tax=Wolfiporia cocos (strain MD-104) TaxID=742152 RepID=A0A2H3IZG4_WOLCO|nr:hypothetical protein WOLCODRAFT_166235 [Wolfiporia cocos MD-104 SS10]
MFEDPADHWRPSMRNIIQLLPVTHVCRRWRDAALETPTLWTSIFLETWTHWKPEFVDMVIRRAGSMPLRVYLDNAIPPVRRAFGNFLQIHGRRIKELHWVCTDPHWISHLAHVRPDGLKALSIYRGYSSEGSNHVFLCGFPALRRLVLKSTLCLPTTDLLHLTYLNLGDVTVEGWAGILSLLSKCPNLEDLVLDTLSPSAEEKQGDPVISSRLRRLLLMNMSQSHGTGISSRLTVAESTVVRICEISLSPNMAAAIAPFPAWKNSTKLCISSVDMYWDPDGDYSANITAVGPITGINIVDCGESEDVEGLPTPGSQHPKTIADWYPALRLLLPTAPIRELWLLDRYVAYQPKLMREVLRLLPCLEILVLRDSSLHR